MKTGHLGIILLCSVFSSCGVDRVYVSATYGNIKKHTEKPIFEKKYDSLQDVGDEKIEYIKMNWQKNQQETEKSSKNGNKVYTYLSGSINDGDNSQGDTQFITSFEVYRSYAQKNINFYYGAGGSFGTYTFGLPYSNIIEVNEKQTFGSLNLRTGTNIVRHTHNIEYRFIGLELLYNYEFGNYQRKISKIPVNDTTVVIAQNSLLSLNLYTEYTWKITQKSRFTFGFYIGTLPFIDTSQNADIDTYFNGCNIGFSYQKYSLYYIGEEGNRKIGSKKIGLVYRF